MKWVLILAIAALSLTQSSSAQTATLEAQAAALAADYGGFVISPLDAPPVVKKAKVTDTLRVKVASGSRWFTKTRSDGDVINKDIYRQKVDLRAFGLVEIHYARFDATEDAYASAEFQAGDASAVFTKGLCGSTITTLLGDQSWCTTSSTGEVGLIVADGTLCLYLFTIGESTTPVADKRDAVIQLAQTVLRKKASLFR